MSIPDQCAALLSQVGDVFTSLSELLPTTANGSTATAVTDTSFTTALITAATTFGADFATVSITTPDRQIEADNQNLIIDTGRAALMIEATRAALTADYASYEDAASMRLTLIEAFDFVMDGIGAQSKNDELYQVINDVRQYAMDTMIAKGANLPVQRTLIVPGDVTPSLVYAQRVYKDITRDAEIAARNPIVMRHPGFPLGGRELKVLSE
jgi:prophage DNA circulation protein